MKILVVSDTHQMLTHFITVLQKLDGHIETCLHLGDCYSDLNGVTKMFPKIKFKAVAGNCDFRQDKPHDDIEKACGFTIWYTHGHRYGVKSDFQRICYAAEEQNADICLFGHTHTPTIFEQNHIIYMNPGSLSLPRNTHYPTYGIIDLTPKKFNCSIVECHPEGYRLFHS